MGWLNALRDIIGKLNLERYRRTRDREYRRDVSEVDPGRFGESTLDDIRSSVVDVDSYNVDVWDIDESKSSGYNVGIFDDVGVAIQIVCPRVSIFGIINISKARGISWSICFTWIRSASRMAHEKDDGR